MIDKSEASRRGSAGGLRDNELEPRVKCSVPFLGRKAGIEMEFSGRGALNEGTTEFEG